MRSSVFHTVTHARYAAPVYDPFDSSHTAPTPRCAPRTLADIAGAFLRLGVASFGGPVAHLGYFRTEFVERRRWLTDAAYAELVALCQFLPGPTSSQVGFAIGLQRGGWAGAVLAWLGFTLPSALLLIALALGLAQFDLRQPALAGALHGLKLAAVAVVAHAVWGMARTLCPDAPRRTLAALAAATALAWSGPWAQWWLIVAAAAWGATGRIGQATSQPSAQAIAEANDARGPANGAHQSLHAAAGWFAAFILLLIGLPVLARATGSAAAELAAVFYRAGALVFGGGHVVLPLLQAEVVPRGWLNLDTFLAGYGAAQAVPGPLFTFAAFVGAARSVAPNGWAGGLLALVAVFAPGMLVLLAALPAWSRLRHLARARSALAAVNAAVVGLLLATWLGLLRPSMGSAADVLIALGAALALMSARVPPWLVALVCALAGAALAGWGPA